MRRTVVTVGGSALVLIGIVLLALPGPGLLVVFAGLTVLATQFAWAERLVGTVRARLPHRRRARRPRALPTLDTPGEHGERAA